MTSCKCGSWAINPRLHGRDNTDLDLCDVCYWRTRAESQAQEIADLRAEQRHHVEELRRDVLGETHEKLARAVEDLGRLNNENVKLQQEIADLYATADHDNELVGKYMADTERLAKENEGLKQEISDLQRAIIWLDETQLHNHTKVRWVFEIIAKAREAVK